MFKKLSKLEMDFIRRIDKFSCWGVYLIFKSKYSPGDPLIVDLGYDVRWLGFSDEKIWNAILLLQDCRMIDIDWGTTEMLRKKYPKSEPLAIKSLPYFTNVE